MPYHCPKHEGEMNMVIQSNLLYTNVTNILSLRNISINFKLNEPRLTFYPGLERKNVSSQKISGWRKWLPPGPRKTPNVVPLLAQKHPSLESEDPVAAQPTSSTAVMDRAINLSLIWYATRQMPLEKSQTKTDLEVLSCSGMPEE